MQAIVANLTAPLPAFEAVRTDGPLPAPGLAGEGAPAAESAAGLPFASVFAEALGPPPAGGAPALTPGASPPAQGATEELPDGNGLPVAATSLLAPLPALPPALPPGGVAAEPVEPELGAEAGSEDAGPAAPAATALPLVALGPPAGAGPGPGGPVPAAPPRDALAPGDLEPASVAPREHPAHRTSRGPAFPAPLQGAVASGAAEGAVQDPVSLAPVAGPEPAELAESGAADGDPDPGNLALLSTSRQRHAAAPQALSAEGTGAPALSPRVGSPGWAPALSDRVAWMVEGEVKQADLRLNPPELGPLEVRISMVDDEARITFTASHPQVREALEAALPKLRDMLGGSGVQLLQVDVSGHGAGHRRPPEAGSGAAAGQAAASRGGSREALAALGTVSPHRQRGLVDAYA
ncbi:MAG: flagellar hook-length control protein FliK [Gammaproteobacteria bacterium]|nr:flagellar hook-length control protein FliK [Gammaproteobacteria bacterium]